MLRLIRKTADAALDLVYPRGVSCALCGVDLDTPGGVLCASCEAKMPFIEEPRCPCCGRGVESEGYCRMCREFGPAADRGFAPFSYEGVARDLLIAFKFEDRTGYRELFAHYMLESLNEPTKSDEVREVHGLCVVPVPMHWRRRLYRGYNQSELLASWVAHSLGVPLVKGILTRPVHTQASARASGGPKERMENAFRSYRRGRGTLPRKTVILVDDILTSGATIRACATLLRQMGAEKVYSLVAAAVPE